MDDFCGRVGSCGEPRLDSVAAGRHLLRLLSFLTLLLVLSVPVHMASGQDPGALPPVGQVGAQTLGSGTAEAGFGLIGEDYFATVAVGSTFGIGPVSFGVQVPLRIMVIDNDPESDKWYREEDWDEVSDWTRIVRFVQYGSPRDPFYARLGELDAAVIGNGTIISRYYNVVDIDHYKTGLAMNVNLDKGGAEFLTNNILSFNLTAIRGYVKPFGLFMDDAGPILGNLVVGTTFAADFTAPWEIRLNDVTGRPLLDGDGNLQFDSSAAWFWGLDVSLPFHVSENAVLIPYTDLNLFKSEGVGWHAGVLGEFRLGDSQMQARLEYRLMSANYAPSYFNSLYELEKFGYLALDDISEAVPKLRYFTQGDLDPRMGFYGELYVNILGMIGVGGAYEDYQGPDNGNVMLRADLPKIQGVKLDAYYARRNFDGLGELFSLDQAMLIAKATVDITAPLYAYGLYRVSWRLNNNKESPNWGEYEGDDNFEFGVGLAFSF